MEYAVSIFDKIAGPNSSAYNVMIRGFTYKQSPERAVALFEEMCQNSVQPDEFTFPCVLKACSRLGALSEGKQIHAQVLKLGFGLEGFVGNTLIHMYASCGGIHIAHKLFDRMPDRGVMTWNSMFAGYSRSGNWIEVTELFRKMLESGVQFDEVTMITVLTACARLADIELGKWVGDYIKANGLKRNPTLTTCLVDMYAKCGSLDLARILFDQMEQKDVVAWSAMISGYSQARKCKEALDLFHQMQAAEVDPNEVTVVSVLSSCAVLGALETGRWLHLFVKKRWVKLTVPLGTALVDFYAKCGMIDKAIEVFMEMRCKNVFSWTALIQGLASNGQGKRALDFFRQMQEENVPPNDVTFLGVLSACSHSGLVEEGRDFFVSMNRDFDIEPRMEHYGSMVDILGRAGRIEEAYQFINNMPIMPNTVIWRTLLASCRAHKNVVFGDESIKRIAEIEPLHSGDYILLSNLYASVGRLEDAMRVRSLIKEKGIKKAPGCSLVELDGVVHEFLSEDDSRSCSSEIYRATEDMINRIRSAGYVPNVEEVRLDVEEDDKEVSLSHHSEKLAIAFALIKTRPRTTIRISKNLRVCSDCHNAAKVISKVFDREIIVRDRNRFHHFKDGSCSCNDFW
ncbi:hypothetical protein CRG98_040967 [Punica granatum]|nr:hypothetical protein CRG98_040967 [Punica granatum]